MADWTVESETPAPLGSVVPGPGGYAPYQWKVESETPIVDPNRHNEGGLFDAPISETYPGTATAAEATRRAAADAASGGATMAAGVANMAPDLISRITRGKPFQLVNPEPLANADVRRGGEALAASPVGQFTGALKDQTVESLMATGMNKGDAENLLGGIGDIAGLAPGAGPISRSIGAGVKDFARANAGMSAVERIAAGKADTARALAGKIPNDAPQAAIPAATAPNEVLQAAGFHLPPSSLSPKRMTGSSAKPGFIAKAAEDLGGEGVSADAIAANRPVVNGWGASDVGLPRESIMTPENIDKASAPAVAGYDSVKQALPTKEPVSDATRAALAAVGQDMAPGYELSPEVLRSNGIFSSDSFNAADLMKSIRAVKAHGNKNLLSDDPIKNDIGKAQIEQANALQAELDSRVATKAPQLNGVYQTARRLWAKIYTVQDALHGYNIDPQAIRKLAYKNDGIDGGLRIIADAATHAPDVVKLNVPKVAGLNSFEAPALMAAPLLAAAGHPYYAALLGGSALARTGARSLLRNTRGETSAANLDKLASPDSSLGNYFGRNDEGFAPQPQSLTLQPSPGPVIEPHQPSVLRSGESMPVRDTGGLPPPGGLSPPLGNAFEPHQRDLLETGGGTSTAPIAAPGLSLAPDYVPKTGAVPKGVQIQENVQVSPMAEHHVEPGATLISEGDSANPKRFISILPKADGRLQVRNTWVSPGERAKGFGQKNITDALDYADGRPLDGDGSVDVSQLRALFAAQDKGLIDFKFRTPELATKAREMVKPGYVGDKKLGKSGGPPVTLNWTKPASLGDALGE